MESNNDILNRVRLLMGYDMSMTLTENLVMEQTKYGTIDRTIPSVGSDYFSGLKSQQKKYIDALHFCNQNKDKCEYIKKSDTVFELVVDSVNKDFIRTGEIGKNFVVNFGKGDLRLAFRDTRDFFIETYAGAFIDIFVSVVGVEVGGPLLMEALEIAFAINDLGFFLEDKENKINKSDWSTWNGIVWQFQNNINFQRLIVDLVVILTRGVIRSAPKALNWLKSSGASMLESLLNTITKVNNIISKLGVVGKYISEGINKLIDFLNKLNKGLSKSGKKSTGNLKTNLTIDKLYSLIKNKKIASYYSEHITKIPKKIPEATVAGAIGVLVQAGLLIGIEKLITSDKSEEVFSSLESPTVDLAADETIKEVISLVREDTPSIKNAKTIKFTGKNSQGIEIFMVDGVEYTYRDVHSDSFELIPYKNKKN